MGENRIVTELFFERPTFKEVSKIARAFEKEGIRYILMPPEDRSINAHLVVENVEMPKVRKKLAELGVNAMESEVIIIKLDNRPGTMADAAKRIAEKGINLTYAFSVAMTSTYSYVLLGSADNKSALKALES